MSFGFSLGDVLHVSALIYKTAKKIQSAPEDFEEAKVIVDAIQDLLHHIEAEYSALHPLIGRHVARNARFHQLLQSFVAPLIQLTDIVEKHSSLGTGKPKIRDRVRLPSSKLQAIQGTLQLRYSSLQAFLQICCSTTLGRLGMTCPDMYEDHCRDLPAIQQQPGALIQTMECTIEDRLASFQGVLRHRPFVIVLLSQIAELMIEQGESDRAIRDCMHRTLVNYGVQEDELDSTRDMIMQMVWAGRESARFVLATPDAWNWRLIDVQEISEEAHLRLVICYNLGMPEEGVTIHLTSPGQVPHGEPLECGQLLKSVSMLADRAATLKLYVQCSDVPDPRQDSSYAVPRSAIRIEEVDIAQPVPEDLISPNSADIADPASAEEDCNTGSEQVKDLRAEPVESSSRWKTLTEGRFFKGAGLRRRRLDARPQPAAVTA